MWLIRGVNQQDYMLWRGLVNICKSEDNIHADRVINKGMIAVNGVYTEKDLSTSKIIHECFKLAQLYTLKPDDYKARKKYCIKYGDISAEEWEDIFRMMHSLKIYNCIKDLQYKILYRFLPTNHLLFKMGKIASPTCSFCHLELESIEHFVFSCYVIRNFWIQVFDRWNFVS